MSAGGLFRAVQIATGTALCCVLSIQAHAESGTDNPVNARLIFPVTVDVPSIHGGEGLKSGDTIYSQTVRSRAAIRLTADHVAKYKPHGVDGLDAKGEVTFPAGTIFVLARTGLGEMYCSAKSESKDTWMTYHDVGDCVRDADHDGRFDQEIVLGAPWRKRIPYEMLGIGGGSWVPASIESEPLPQSEMPALQLVIKYQEASNGRQKGYLSVSLDWPRAMVSEGAGEDTGKWGGSLLGVDLPKSGFAIPASGRTEVACRLFTVTLDFAADRTVKTDIATILPVGQASMFVAGKFWTMSNYKYQVPIMAFRSGDVEILPPMERI